MRPSSLPDVEDAVGKQPVARIEQAIFVGAGVVADHAARSADPSDFAVKQDGLDIAVANAEMGELGVRVYVDLAFALSFLAHRDMVARRHRAGEEWPGRRSLPVRGRLRLGC